jgi:protein arginine N-methyltransferase 7
MKDDAPLQAAAFEALVAAARAKPRALLTLSRQARRFGNISKALALANEARDLAGSDRELAICAADEIARTIPRFHVPMIRDEPRNRAFEDALNRAITPETRVLDVGSGTGLLAMMAARAGARQVYSCELNPAMAEVAQEIVRANGLADRVTVFAKKSSDLDAGKDLGGPVDLVIAEIIGKDLVCEKVLPSMRDVASRLAKPGAAMIPKAGEIRVALAWWDGLASRPMGLECGFDMTPFNRLLLSRLSLKVGDAGLHLRGPAASLFSFDFAATTAPQERATLDLVADGGPVNGVVQWLRLQMDDVASFENQPAPGTVSSWACLFFPLPQPLDVDAAAGTVVKICASHSGNKLRIWPETP